MRCEVTAKPSVAPAKLRQTFDDFFPPLRIFPQGFTPSRSQQAISADSLAARTLPKRWIGGCPHDCSQEDLVPIDFGETSKAALKYGVALARAFNARLYLLHVPEHPGEAARAEYPIGLFETMKNAAHDQRGQLLNEAEMRDLQPERSMRIGTPSDEIVAYANEQKIDLIIMGTHGREGVARVFVGSVAEKVVRRAPCPVMTVHHPEHEFLAPDKTVEPSARTGLTA
jgi:nucleotide-binding universal stress UspA family protein